MARWIKKYQTESERRTAWAEAMRRTMTTHGATRGGRTPEYTAWRNLVNRCTQPSSSRWSRYGGRGIVVCDRWLGDDGFANFMIDMGPRPSSDHSIDRRNTNGDYTPENCRWATRTQQHETSSTTKVNALGVILICALKGRRIPTRFLGPAFGIQQITVYVIAKRLSSSLQFLAEGKHYG